MTKTKNSLLKLVLTWLAVVLLISPVPAQAYLDPGAGSYVVQLTIGTLLGAGMSLKLFWQRIMALWLNK